MKHKSFLIIRYVLLTALASGLLFIGSCSIDSSGSKEDSVPAALKSFMPLPPDAIVGNNPETDGEIPEATVEIDRMLEKKAAEKPVKILEELTKSSSGGPSLSPAVLNAELEPGESVAEIKTAYIPGAPPKGDVLIAFDLTGSMMQELSNVKNNSINIMNSVRGVIPDTNFGVVSHMDYYGTHSDSLLYGYPARPYGDKRIYDSEYYYDYPYNLDQPLTADTSLVQAVIGDSASGLKLGNGADYPESYTRVLYESYADSETGWREGAKKIMLFWLDYIPHSLDPFLDGSQPSTGPDPGRDEIDGTSDDLDLQEVLDGMKDNNITLIALYSSPPTARWYGSYGELLIDYWKKYAGITGGDAYQINTDGTIPGGTDIGTYVAGLIQSEIEHADLLKLAASDGYEAWLTSADEYTDVDLSAPWTGTFNITVTVPAGTDPGDYSFEVILDGDGVEYAKQTVNITVPVPNSPPVADAGYDVTAEQDSYEGAGVYLDGSASYDPDGDLLSYEWSWDGGSASGVSAMAVFPPGTTEVTLTVDDGRGLTDSDTVLITVADTTPPLIDFELLADTIWPPNHKMVNIGTVSVSDIGDSSPVLEIEITHNEDPHENTGAGDGNHEPDWQIDEDGTVWIRAERNGTGEDRIYTITVYAEDASGNTAEESFIVTVPHDLGDKDRERIRNNDE